MAKTLSRATHVWSHVAVIVFHVLLGALLVWTATRGAPWGWKPERVYKSCGWLLLIVSLLGLIPILMDHGEITIEA